MRNHKVTVHDAALLFAENPSISPSAWLAGWKNSRKLRMLLIEVESGNHFENGMASVLECDRSMGRAIEMLWPRVPRELQAVNGSPHKALPSANISTAPWAWRSEVQACL
ncbi:MAG: hypothetical protein U1A24_03700 [Cypionkella sp.]|uniref:hypothetical protein n=1 Tax=Cypionkella sp. TaxID=2811411 RepID=UPI002ABA9C5C|nr:hypothetical protein [Cypionkella sp.]MDZ4309648.1 hypothetical protein [Cypionkella sp.]